MILFVKICRVSVTLVAGLALGANAAEAPKQVDVKQLSKKEQKMYGI
jgi:hypothetical protein